MHQYFSFFIPVILRWWESLCETFYLRNVNLLIPPFFLLDQAHLVHLNIWPDPGLFVFFFFLFVLGENGCNLKTGYYFKNL